MGKYKDGRYKEMPETIKHITGRSLKIESKEKMVINIDGEILEGSTAEFTIEPGKLRFFYPKGTEW